jgi:hypothetical protein
MAVNDPAKPGRVSGNAARSFEMFQRMRGSDHCLIFGTDSDPFDEPTREGWMTFSDLVNQNIGLSFRKQFAMEDFLSERTWRLDHAKGRIDFGKGPGLFARRRTYPIQILGTEDKGSGTWLWAWANTQSGFPPSLLKAAERVRLFGESEGVAELVTAVLPASEYPGHLLACVAAGIADADCYYPGAIAGGASFMLIFETPLRHAPPTEPVRMIRVLTQVTGQ